MTTIQQRLFELQDPKYRDFQCKLIPTVDPKTVIGVRTPVLRKLAGELAKTPEADAFLEALPHRYYDENNLHGFLIERIRDYDRVIEELNRFLPYVDNWATCDLMRPRVFDRNLPRLREQIPLWLGDSHPFTVRFGMEMLMTYFLDGEFRPEYLTWAAEVHREEYYVNMMIAWFFATALAKQYEDAVAILRQGRLSDWTHNKAIQKAIESDRIPKERKEILRKMKR